MNLFINNLLSENPADRFFFFAVVLTVVVSIVLHELAHGWMAMKLGDPTPRLEGRMTGNPLVHMGPWSLLALALAGIAWGSMPIDPSDRPRVTVIMPVRDEGAYIERSLGAVLEQSVGLDRMEILIVDGRSRDDTRERARSLARRNPGASVEILDNPGRTAPCALNIGLRAAQGEIVVRVDGHCEIGPDYVAHGIRHLFH